MATHDTEMSGLTTQLKTLSVNDLTDQAIVPLDMNVTGMSPERPKIGPYSAFAAVELIAILDPYMKDGEELDPSNIELISIEREKCFSFMLPENMVEIITRAKPEGIIVTDDQTTIKFTTRKGTMASGTHSEKAKYFGHLERPARTPPIEIDKIKEALAVTLYPLGFALHPKNPVREMHSKSELPTKTGRYHVDFNMTSPPDVTRLKSLARINIKGMSWRFILNTTFRREFNLCDTCYDFIGRYEQGAPSFGPTEIAKCRACSLESTAAASSTSTKGKSKEEKAKATAGFIARFKRKRAEGN